MSRDDNRLARITGVLFLVTFVTAIAAVPLYSPLMNHADFVLGAGEVAGVQLGAVLELILIIANIGTGLALYPVLKRQNEALASSSAP